MDDYLNSFVSAMSKSKQRYKQYECIYPVLNMLIGIGFKPLFKNTESRFGFRNNDINIRIEIKIRNKEIELKFSEVLKGIDKTTTKTNYFRYQMKLYDIENEEEFIRLINDMTNDIRIFFKKQVPMIHSLIRKNKIKKVLNK